MSYADEVLEKIELDSDLSRKKKNHKNTDKLRKYLEF